MNRRGRIIDRRHGPGSTQGDADEPCRGYALTCLGEYDENIRDEDDRGSGFDKGTTRI